MQRLIQSCFWAAIAITLYLCFRKPIIIADVSDKAEHAVTFGGLMVLAAFAWPRARLFLQGLALSGVGAFIEFAQPYFGRDKDVKDWIADTIGILVAIIVILIARRLAPALRGI